MRKLSAMFLATVFMLTVSGCLDITTKVTLRADGGGTIEETTLMSKEALKMLSSFAGDTTGSAFNIYSEEELIEKAASFGEGVKFVSAENVERNEMKGIKAVFSFDDISKVNVEGTADNDMGGTPKESDEEKETIKFSFRKGVPAKLEIFMPKPEEAPAETKEEKTEADSSAGEFLEGFKSALSEIKMAVYLEIDGKIIDTDAEYRDGNKITLVKIEFNKIIEDPETFKKIKYSDPKTLADIEELAKDIPGIEIETSDKIFVDFE